MIRFGMFPFLKPDICGAKDYGVSALLKKIAVVLLVIFFSNSCFWAAALTALPPENEAYDLIVVGGEPEGIAAAISAARQGVKTLLVEEGEVLGGLFTLGGLNFLDMSYGPEGELLTRGIFAEFHQKLGNAFDLERAAKYFAQLVAREEKIDLKLNTAFIAPLVEENVLRGIKVREQGAEKVYYASRVIDATVDADVAAQAGVPYTLGAEDYGHPEETMGVTLVFRVKGVNWPYVFLYNNGMRLLSKLKSTWGDPYAGANMKVAWGYGAKALQYSPQDPLMRFRGPNLARQKDGTVLLNALLIFGVDSLDPLSRATAIKRGQAEIPYILAFMRRNFPGFARVKLVETAPRLYVRETRHIQGEYRLTITDVLENRDHWDRIAHGSYPVDLQPTSPDNLGNVIGKPALYSIPFRCLVPQKIENLLVVGRSASFDSLAHGSARVVPVGMATGEAAGVAVAYSLEKELNFRELSKDKESLGVIQKRLREQGAYLQEFTPPRSLVMDHWAYPGVKVMRELGLAAGGYDNNYRLEQQINYWDANYLFQQVLKKQEGFVFTTEITLEELLSRTVLLLSGQEMDFARALDFLTETAFLGETEAPYFVRAAETPNFGQLYTLGAILYQAMAMDKGGKE